MSHHPATANGDAERPPRRGLHRDWRTWLAVLVLLLAAGTYVLNLDRVAVPISGNQKPIDAAPTKP